MTAAAAMKGQRERGVCMGDVGNGEGAATDVAVGVDVAEEPALPKTAGWALLIGAELVPPDGVIAAMAWPLEGVDCAAVSACG